MATLLLMVFSSPVNLDQEQLDQEQNSGKRLIVHPFTLFVLTFPLARSLFWRFCVRCRLRPACLEEAWRFALLRVKSGNNWLGGRDSNPDSQIQSLESYHWTTSQHGGI